MISDTTYDIISIVANTYVPNKKHKLLHVVSRDAWVDLIIESLNKGLIKPKMGVIMKCAHNWELLLINKISRLN